MSDARREVLRVEGLTTRVMGRAGIVTPVDAVSFSVPAGQMVALVGESGSGKSLTCASVMRILPPSAGIAAGRILFGGEDLATKTQREMSRIRGDRISMVLQDPMSSLNPLFTIGDQVGEVIARHRPGIDRKSRRRQVVSLLERVRIPAAAERLDSYPHQFSGGMRQRVSIAMNIACNPDLLIADEPTTALDVTVQQQVFSLFRELQRDMGMAILLVTHNLDVVTQWCDHVLVMYAGRIVEQGPVAQVLRKPAHPYTAGLLAAVPRLGAGLDELAAIPGQPPALDALGAGCRFAPRCGHATALCHSTYPEWISGIDGTAGTAGTRGAACWIAGQAGW